MQGVDKNLIGKKVEQVIDEKKLLADLNNLLFTTEMNSVASKTIEQCIECVDNQPQSVCSRREWYQRGYQDGLNADKWIPCSERLPSEENEYYLVYQETEYITVLMWTKLGWNTFKTHDGEYSTISELKNVIAWQPLPAPYKKEGAYNG